MTADGFDSDRCTELSDTVVVFLARAEAGTMHDSTGTKLIDAVVLHVVGPNGSDYLETCRDVNAGTTPTHVLDHPLVHGVDLVIAAGAVPELIEELQRAAERAAHRTSTTAPPPASTTPAPPPAAPVPAAAGAGNAWGEQQIDEMIAYHGTLRASYADDPMLTVATLLGKMSAGILRDEFGFAPDESRARWLHAVASVVGGGVMKTLAKAEQIKGPLPNPHLLLLNALGELAAAITADTATAGDGASS